MADGITFCDAGVAGSASRSTTARVVDRHIGVLLGGDRNHDFAGDLCTFLGETSTHESRRSRKRAGISERDGLGIARSA